MSTHYPEKYRRPAEQEQVKLPIVLLLTSEGFLHVSVPSAHSLMPTQLPPGPVGLYPGLHKHV